MHVVAKHTRVNALRPVHGRGAGVRAWLVWQLPRWLIAFIGIVVLAAIVLYYEFYVTAAVTPTLHPSCTRSRCREAPGRRGRQ